MTVRNQADDGILDEYSVEVLRVNEANLSEGIPDAKTKIEISNAELSTITKEDDTNTGGSIYIKNGIKGPGETEIKITETEKVDGYEWNATERVVRLERNPQTEQMRFIGSNEIPSARVSIDHQNKLVKIILGSNKTKANVQTTPIAQSPFKVNLVTVVKGTSVPVGGTYSIEIGPNPADPGPGWKKTSYLFENRVTKKTSPDPKYFSPKWNGWLNAFEWPLIEHGLIEMKGIYGTGDILIDIEEEQLSPGFKPLEDIQHIKVHRDEHRASISGGKRT